MKSTLLKVKTIEVNGRTKLKLTRVGGQTCIIDAPFDPFYYAPRVPTSGADAGADTFTLLSTLQKAMLHKITFPNVDMLKRSRIPDGILDDVPYDQNVATHLGFNVQSAMPVIGAYDLEMASRNGAFPDARYDSITDLSYVSDKSAEVYTLEHMPEYEVISKFFDKLDSENIDVPADYFGSWADMMWLQLRCQALNIPFRMGRGDDTRYLTPWCKTTNFKMGKKTGEDKSWDIPQRVHFDVFKEVIQDQSLFGIKNRQLKTVAEWFGIPVIRVDRAKLNTLKPEERAKYCLSDGQATLKLAKIYVRNLVPLTERFRIAFNMCVQRSPSHISNYAYAREFNALKIIADKNNAERYPDFANENGRSYQAALVDLFEAGFYEERLGHIDYNSMYPSNMICFNYSPESIFDFSIEPSNVTLNRDYSGSVHFKDNRISIYDQFLGWINLRVDLSKDSVSRTLLKALGAERKQLKAEMKSAKTEDEKEVLNSQQWCVKVPMNSIPGYHGMGYAKYGCFPIAAHITGLGRWEISHATNFVSRMGFKPIQRHTDGLYFIGDDVSKDLTAYIQSLIPNQFEANAISVGFERFDAMIAYETNGYILLDKSKPKPRDLIFKSSALKGKHLPKICDKALEYVVRGIFAHDDVMGMLHNFRHTLKSDTNLEDFVMTIKLSKEPDGYNNTTQYAKLIQKARMCGLSVRFGDEFQYVKTREASYMPVGALLTRSYTIDVDYYLDRVASVLERPLRVTHGLTLKQITYALKGYIVTPQKRGKQMRLRARVSMPAVRMRRMLNAHAPLSDFKAYGISRMEALYNA